MIWFLLQYLPSIIKMKIRALAKENWHIRLIRDNDTIVIKHRQAGFWADPFIFVKDGQSHIFFENYLDQLGRGIISHVCVNKQGELSEDTEIFKQPYHLSYPHLIEYDGSLFMIPESKSANAIQLLKCEEFPFKWNHHKNIVSSIQAVDSTVIQHNNLYWLFCTVQTGSYSNSSDVLMIYYCDKLDGEWKQHAQNPIKLSNCASRSAGNFFYEDGLLCRPVQNSRKGYGHAIDVYAVTTLTTTAYEDVFKYTLPSAKYHKQTRALHTYNTHQHQTVIDIICPI